LVCQRKKHIITLSSEERAALEKVSLSNRRSILEKTRARILLLSDTGVSREGGGSFLDSEILVRFKVKPLTVSDVRQRAHERGALACLKQQEQKTRKIDGAQEAQLLFVQRLLAA
jgi:hypothetical protein